jgi:hypothetical protein
MILATEPRATEHSPKVVHAAIVTLTQAESASARAQLLVRGPFLNRGQEHHLLGGFLSRHAEKAFIVLSDSAIPVGQFPEWKLTMLLEVREPVQVRNQATLNERPQRRVFSNNETLTNR